MAFQQFIVSDVNPNDNHGGGGCICDPRKQGDCHGPFAVFYGNDMADPYSPHVVMGLPCVDAVHDRMHQAIEDGEVLESGERSTITEAAAVQETPARREPPVVESPDPRHDFDDETPDI